MSRLVPYLFIFSLILFLSASTFAFFNSNPDLPQPNSYGDLCLSYVAKDGCNTCEADGSCTEIGCICPSEEKGEDCIERLQSRALTCLKYGLSSGSAKQVPPLEGKRLGTCLSALLPTQSCTVNTTSDYTWSCRNIQDPIPTPFDSPLCMADGKGQPVNREEYEKLFAAARHHKNLTQWHQRFQTEAFCMKWEDHCWYHLYNYYPPQTKFPGLSSRGPSYIGGRHKIHSGQGHATCHKLTKNQPRKNECTLEITLKDFPPIDFASQDQIRAQFSIEKEDQCVRYDNRCHAIYLALDESPRDSGELVWVWFHSKKTSCSRQERKDTLNETMVCTSYYKASNF